jgi:acyl carrier protein
MGIDPADLCLCLEERLGIEIPHTETWTIFSTPGTMQHYLMAKLRGQYRESPDAKSLCIEVEKAVHRITGWWKLVSSSDLNRRFSPPKREANWQSLENALGVSLPKLEYLPGERFPKIPRECDSVLYLTNWIIKHHPNRVKWLPGSCERRGKMADHQWTEEEVWEVLRDCIVEVLGVKREKVTHDARMIEDLGMD